jgi:hypothetical protein
MPSKLNKTYRGRIDGRPPPFYGVFLQVAHVDNNPKSEEPMYRVLRFIHQKETIEKAQAFIAKRMSNQGNIIFVRYGEPILIAKSQELQMDNEYITRRTQEIEEGWMAAFDDNQLRHEKFREYRKTKKDDAALAIHTNYAAKYNTFGWVKYMKSKVGFTDADVLEPGVRCEAPPDEDGTTDFEDEDVDLHLLPDRITASDQKHLAVSVLVTEDDSMETVLYIHDVMPDIRIENEDARTSFESKMNSLGMFCTPLPIDVVDVGVWNMPIRDLWTLQPDEQSWTDGELNTLQKQRVVDARKQDREKATLLERERQTELAIRDLARVAELDFELVKHMCKTPKGAEELTHAVKLASKGSRDDAIELCIEKYGGSGVIKPQS